MVRSSLVLCVMIALGSCGGGGRKTALDTLLTREVASRLPRGLVDLAEVLPAGIEAFAYLELGDHLREVPPQLADYRAMFQDLAEMAVRRWGVDPRKVRGVGVILIEKKVVLVGELEASALAKPVDGLAVARLGKLSAVGSPAAIAAISSAFRDRPRLHVAQPEWIKQALRHAVGQPFVASVAVDGAFGPMLAELPAAIGEIEMATLTVGATGAVVQLGAKPGKSAAVRSLIETSLIIARAELDKHGMELASEGSSNGPEELLGSLLRRYNTALFSSIHVTEQGDEVGVRLGWHAPVLPASVALEGLAPRAVAPGEWSVVQVDFGTPLIELMIAATDVLEVPLDRAALVREVSGGLGKILGAPPLDPQRLAVSIGSDVLVSIQGQPAPAERKVLELAGGAWLGATTKWGLIVSPSRDRALLDDALANRAKPPLPLMATSSAAKGPAFFRWVADLRRAPAGVMGGLPMEAVEVLARGSRVEVTAEVTPGQGPALQAMAANVGAAAVAEAERSYRGRQQASVETEVLSIFQYHQAGLIQRMLTPTSVTADRVRFERDFPQLESTALLVAGGVGIVAAVAVPAFMDYMKKSKASEAELQLAKIKSNAKVAYLTDAAFPTASASPTPAVACCAHAPDRKCPASAAAWATSAWQALDFQIDEPHYFRYQYESTPTRFTARATGDLDCDGVEIQYVLVGEIVNGDPIFTLTKPIPNSD